MINSNNLAAFNNSSAANNGKLLKIVDWNFLDLINFDEFVKVHQASENYEKYSHVYQLEMHVKR
jgi:hypothetical protein